MKAAVDAEHLKRLCGRVRAGDARGADDLVRRLDGAPTDLVDMAFAELVEPGQVSPQVTDVVTRILLEQLWLRGEAYRILLRPDEVDETVQDALLAVSQKLAEFRGEAKLRTWVTSIVRNIAIGNLRRRRDASTLDGDEAIGAGERFSSMLATRADLEILLDGLPGDFASVVRLRDIERNSYADIADQLGIPINTVRSRLARGRARLADQLSDRA